MKTPFEPFHTISAAVLFCVGTVAASAAVVWDYSPATTGASGPKDWANLSYDQNFVEQIRFSQDTILSGMDIYSQSIYGSLGQSVTVRLFGDSGGQPAALLGSLVESINVVDADGVGAVTGITRKHAGFSSPLFLLANTSYWIGMSGTSAELVQMGLTTPAPGDSRMWQLIGAAPYFQTASVVGDMAFRLEGTVVPEPSVFALLALPLGAHCVQRLRRRSQLS